jgi:putative redox protein
MTTQPFDFQGVLGQGLSGRLDLPDGRPEAYALFAHCFTCTKASLAATRIARALTARGFGVLRFDFTGLGQSGGAFEESMFAGSIADVAAAARAMAAAGRSPQLLIGHSLGGAAVLAAALDLDDVAAVATIGAPCDVQHVRRLFGAGLDELLETGAAEVDIGGRPFRMRREFLDDLASHDQRDRVHRLRRPVLVLHSPQDQVVPIENASAIFTAARHPKSFISLDGADHLLTRAADAEYSAEVISAWASRYLQKPAPLRSETQEGGVVVEETGAGGFQLEVRAGRARFLVDEPPEVGGLGSGPTPYDLLSAGLAACTAITLRMYARRKGFPLQTVRVSAAHARDASAAPADRFSREIALLGPLSGDQRARLLEIAERCPVHRTLTAGARVTTSAVDQPSADLAAEKPIQHALDAQRACSRE